MGKKCVVLVCLFLLLAGVAAVFCLKNRENGIYRFFEVNHKEIAWGMNAEEVIAVIGEPDSVTEADSGVAVILHYSDPVETVIGISKGADIYVNTAESKSLDNESCTLGFIQIDLFFEGSDEKKIITQIEKNYGLLDGGRTYLDDVLSEVDPDLFSSTYYLKTGMVGELPQQVQYDMLKVLKINNPEGSEKFIGSLVNFYLIGNKEKVKVTVNAKNLLTGNLAGH